MIDKLRYMRRTRDGFRNNYIQSHYFAIDSRGAQIEFVDMHFGSGPSARCQSEFDPYIVDDHLREIQVCSKVSKSVFFIVS